jgi:uncharacterized membrane protein YkvA (DUF1232 family)
MPKIETLEHLVDSPYYPRDEKQLAAARAAIAHGLPKKLRSKKLPSRVKTDARWLASVLQEKRWKKKKGVDAIVAAGLLYLLNGKDAIPDKLPFTGYFDDSLVLEVVIRSIQVGVAK